MEGSQHDRKAEQALYKVAGGFPAEDCIQINSTVSAINKAGTKVPALTREKTQNQEQKKMEGLKMSKWSFYCIDNKKKKQFFTVSAKDKTSAIEKGFAKAKKNAKGDVNNWECKLVRA